VTLQASSIFIRVDEREMTEAPIISTVDDACTIVSNWFGWKDDLAGGRIALRHASEKQVRRRAFLPA